MTGNNLCYNIVSIMLQQIIRVGNSAAITIPKDFLRETKIKIGDQILVEADSTAKTIILKPKKTKKASLISPELGRWTKNFIKKYRPLLDELAKK